MFFNYPSAVIARWRLERAGRQNCVIDVVCFRVSPRVPGFGAKMLPQRRCSKNSGGGVRPPPLGSYRGRVLHRQRFPGPEKPKIRPEMAHKVLMRLNLSGTPAIGLTALRARQI